MYVMIGTLLFCISLLMMFFELYFAGIFWIVVSILILVCGFNEWFKGKDVEVMK